MNYLVSLSHNSYFLLLISLLFFKVELAVYKSICFPLLSLRDHDSDRDYTSQPHNHVDETSWLDLTHEMRMEVMCYLQDQVFKELMTSSCFLFLILTVTSEDCYALRDGQNRAHKEFSFLNDSTGENHPLTNNTDTEFMCARKKKKLLWQAYFAFCYPELLKLNTQFVYGIRRVLTCLLEITRPVLSPPNAIQRCLDPTVEYFL